MQDRCITTNTSSLRDFYSWYNLRNRWEKAAARSLDVQELIAAADPTLSPEKVEAAGQLVFLNEAIEAGGAEGAKAFVSLSRLRLSQKAHQAELDGFRLKYEQKEREIEQKERQMALDREKFEFDAAEAALKEVAALKSIAADRTINHDAKIAQVRQRLFGLAPAITTEAKP